MADETGKKISQLPLGENLADNDLMYAVEDGVSKKVKVSYLQDRIVGDVDSTPTASSDNLVTSGGVYNMVHTLDFNVFHDLAQISNSIADAFSASESYSEGDYVVYDYSLYKFTADKSAGAWDSSKATPVAVVEELGSGGTTVVPNPSGEATDTLKKLKIDQTIYDFAASNVYGEASGAIASFADGSANPLKSLEVDINPIQDLHGYDKPWASGAGKNKFDYSAATDLSGMSNDNGVFTNTGTDTRTMFALAVQQFNGSSYVTQNMLNISDAGRYSVTFTVSQEITKLRIKHNGSTLDLRFDYPFTTQGTFTISFTMISANPTVVGGLSFKDVMIESGSTATDYAPYSNICPISGWTGANTTVAGKNLLPMTRGYNFTYNVEVGTTLDVETDVDDWTDEGNGIFTITLGDWVKSGWLSEKLSAGKTVTLSALFVSGQARLCSYTLDSDYKVIRKFSIYNPIPNNTNYTFQVTLEGEECYIAISVSGKGEKITVNNPQLEAGSTATSYEAYNSNTTTHSISWQTEAGTVYGGKLNVTTGELTVDRTLVDMGDLYWSYDSGASLFTASIQGIKSGTYTDTNLISSIYPVKPMSYSQFDYGMRYNSATSIGVKNPDYTSASDFKTAMDGVQLVYELATPTTITLTPTQVSSLLGNNNIWADSGDVDVVYIRDLNIAVNKLLEGDVYDGNEKVVGTYFGNTLYAKSYDINNPSNDASIITEDFSNKIITDITAIGIRSSDGAIIPLQFSSSSNWMRVYAGTIYGGIYLESNIAISNIKITVKYTKSST